MLHVRKRGEVRAEVWCGNLRHRPLREPRRTLEDNIKMNTTDTGDDGVDWFGMAHDRDR